MLRASFVVDGFNLYHSLKDAGKETGGTGVKWLDLRALCRSNLNVIKNGLGLRERIELGGVYFYTSLPSHLKPTQPGLYERHEQYNECLKWSGVNVSLGHFILKSTYCINCTKTFDLAEEKQTDVNVGVKIMDLAVNSPGNIIVLVGGDSDICPAISWAKQHDPTSKVVIMFPYTLGSKELRKCSDYAFSLKPQAYRANQFPSPYNYPGGSISKPAHW